MIGWLRKAFAPAEKKNFVDCVGVAEVDPVFRKSVGGMGSARAQIEAIHRSSLAYAICQKIASSVAQVPFVERDADDGFAWESALSRRLANPGIEQSAWFFKYTLALSMAMTGNGYVRRVSSSSGENAAIGGRINVPQDMEAISPNDIVLEFGTDSTVARYLVTQPNGSQVDVPPADILHLRLPNLLDRFRGLSPTVPGANAIDTFQGISEVTRQIVSNGAMIPAIINLTGTDHSDEQFQELVKELGAKRARGGEKIGTILVTRSFDGKLELIEVPIAKDLIGPITRGAAVEDVCNAFGFPSILLKIGENATYTNMAEARRYFWEETVIPLYLEPMARGMSKWFGATVGYDVSEVAAIQARQHEIAKNISSNTFLTQDEKRRIMGYEPLASYGEAVILPASSLTLEQIADPTMREEDDPLVRDQVRGWLDYERQGASGSH